MNMLRQYCDEELKQVDSIIRNITHNTEKIICEVSDYIQESPGKRLRPSIVIMSSKLFGYDGEEHLKLGAAVELLHTATLIHDDIIDKAQTRRGKPSVNARWGTEIALLVADFYFASAFNLVLSTGVLELAGLLSNVASKMCEGELFQQELKEKFLTRTDYFKIIKHKTAYLFSACAQFGACIARTDKANIEKVGNFGMNLGMAFQIVDDTLDFVATDEKWGKPLASDIKQGKQTLPFIYTLESATPDHQEELRHFFTNGKNIHKIINIIKKYNGFEYA
ncbi:polyprenyl synthetase family protein, partial [Candidatus Sumerlaeota bacterium]|nr:polyprenyl synthetase family protein [Candidatus Sumerlaeota bacterium]